MDRGAWQTTVHGVAKSWAKLNDSEGREGAQGGFNLHLLMNNGVEHIFLSLLAIWVICFEKYHFASFAYVFLGCRLFIFTI